MKVEICRRTSNVSTGARSLILAIARYVFVVVIAASSPTIDSAAQPSKTKSPRTPTVQRSPRPTKDAAPKPGAQTNPAETATQAPSPSDADGKTPAAAGEGEGEKDPSKLADLKAEEPLPRLQELEVPTIDALHKSPVDWIVLKGPNKGNELVVVVRPVYPRPDTLRKLEAALEELRKQPRPTTDEERERLADQRYELLHLLVTLPSDATAQLYEIPTQSIERIVYHEELTIRRSAVLLEEKRFRDAFELLFELERKSPTWRGLAEQMNRLVFAEAEDAAKKGNLESALTFLEELHGRERNYPELQDRLGRTVDALIERSRKANGDREARFFLWRLARIEPDHPTAVKWRKQLLAEARGLEESALVASRDGRHDLAAATIDRAVRIWPTTPGLPDTHRRLGARYQRLQVGSLNRPGESPHLPFPTLADQREARLTQFDLFEVDRIDDSTHYRSRLFEQWEPTDLGRRAVFTLKSTRARWESRPILTSTDVVSTLEALLDPSGPSYDERLGNTIGAVQLLSPFSFEIEFAHAPPRTEPLFRFPVSAGGAATAESRSSRILSRRFERVPGAGEARVYRRVIPQPDGLTEYQVAEVVEHPYESPELAIQGLLRGDVSMLPDLPTWAAALLRQDKHFFVLPYAIPTTHVLQFNPHSAPLKSRELRLALAYAVDAPRILSQVVLRDPKSEAGRTVTAPYATTSYAYNRLVPAREYSPSIAAALFQAAAKRLKTKPTLRMLCSPGIASEAAAAELVRHWKRAGIQVEIVAARSAPASAPITDWDLAYRTIRVEEPFVELAPFLCVDRNARIEILRNFPDWLRLELINLDNTPDWKSAVAALQLLHTHLYSEVACIPLWEVNDEFVLRKNVRDFPSSKFIWAYQDVERWIVQSWFPETP